MTSLVLSLFPGIGLLDLAFEEEGFTVVRGPDLLWGGDIRRFHPPAGRFDGIIGGPPCQAFSRMRHLVAHNGFKVAENLIPEFERCVHEAQPQWFVMENVPDAPQPSVPGFAIHAFLANNRWTGADQNRLRRFSFGTQDGRRLRMQWVALESVDYTPAVTANGTRWVPVKMTGKYLPDGTAKVKRTHRPASDRSTKFFEEAKRAQGLPDDFDLPPFTVAAKVRAVGNGVPLPLGRAIAAAVREATEKERAA